MLDPRHPAPAAIVQAAFDERAWLDKLRAAHEAVSASKLALGEMLVEACREMGGVRSGPRAKRWGDFLQKVAAEVGRDVRTLRRYMEAAGGEPDLDDDAPTEFSDSVSETDDHEDEDSEVDDDADDDEPTAPAKSTPSVAPVKPSRPASKAKAKRPAPLTPAYPIRKRPGYHLDVPRELWGFVNGYGAGCLAPTAMSDEDRAYFDQFSADARNEVVGKLRAMADYIEKSIPRKRALEAVAAAEEAEEFAACAAEEAEEAAQRRDAAAAKRREAVESVMPGMTDAAATAYKVDGREAVETMLDQEGL
jgi:hypothetical protein